MFENAPPKKPEGGEVKAGPPVRTMRYFHIYIYVCIYICIIAFN